MYKHRKTPSIQTYTCIHACTCSVDNESTLQSCQSSLCQQQSQHLGLEALEQAFDHLLYTWRNHERSAKWESAYMHIQVQWQGRYTQITYLSYLCNTRNLLKVWKATLVVKTVRSLADSFLQKQKNCQFILLKARTAQWQVILSQESIYSWKHFTVQRWTYSSYNEVGKSWQAVNDSMLPSVCSMVFNPNHTLYSIRMVTYCH